MKVLANFSGLEAHLGSFEWVVNDRTLLTQDGYVLHILWIRGKGTQYQTQNLYLNN